MFQIFVRHASCPDVDALPPERLPEQLDHLRCGLLTETQRHLSLLRSYLAVRITKLLLNFKAIAATINLVCL